MASDAAAIAIIICTIKNKRCVRKRGDLLSKFAKQMAAQAMHHLRSNL